MSGAGPICIVSSGDELLEGRIVDTNAGVLSQRIQDRGLEVLRVVAVGDSPAALHSCWADARRDGAAGVVMTGGLGDTRDDLTREAMASFFGVQLELQPRALEQMQSFYLRLGRTLPDAEPAEACLPQGAVPILNPSGVAPGVFLADESFFVLAMPGVPQELIGMMDEGALDHLPVASHHIAVGRVGIVGIPERKLGRAFESYLVRGRNPLVAIAPKKGHVELCVRATHETVEGARQLLQEDMVSLAGIRPDNVFSLKGWTPAERVGQELLDRGLTIAVAESLTGGLIGHQLTEIPGISDVFLADFVTYSNAAKASVLGVSEDDIEKHGAVSECVARAMAAGARHVADSDLALATTGVAGPGGGSDEKPVGKVWVAVADENGCSAESQVFPGNRNEVKHRSAAFALDLLRRHCLWGQGG